MSNPPFSTPNMPDVASPQPDDLSQISELIHAAAVRREGDSLALLDLLRQLNNLHYDIRETLFRDALPNNRQKLYSLLKDIEQEGGWPYIPRMKLLALLGNMEMEDANTPNTDASSADAPSTGKSNPDD
ncbi:MAG: hypothetical protein AAF703_04970 [Cyanobacteria bacterium P01_D01_bin.105]